MCFIGSTKIYIIFLLESSFYLIYVQHLTIKSDINYLQTDCRIVNLFLSTFIITQLNFIFEYSLEKNLYPNMALVQVKGTVSRDRFQKFWQNLQNQAFLRDAAGFSFFRVSDDFIMQKVYLLRLMPVWVGVIMFIA